MSDAERNSGSWQVNQAKNDVFVITGDKLDLEHNGTKEPAPLVPVQLETPAEKRLRKRSHNVAHALMFVTSVGFTVVLNGVWAYLRRIDDGIEKSALGFVVAAFPLGQMVAAPLVGVWVNRAGSIRVPAVVLLIVSIAGNVMYATLHAFSNSGQNIAYYMMILSRFIVGLSAANISLWRSYIVGATVIKERSTALTVMTSSQTLATVLSSGIQALLTIVIPHALDSGIPGLVLDQYTCAAWVAVLMGVVALGIILPCVFQEHYIAAKEYEVKHKQGNTSAKITLSKGNYYGLITSCFAYFVGINALSVQNTISVPIVTDQYGVADTTAVLYVSIAMATGGIISLGIYFGITRIIKKFDERKVMIYCGFVVVAVGAFAHYPIGNTPIVMANCTSSTNDTTASPAIISAVTPAYHPLQVANNLNSPVPGNTFLLTAYDANGGTSDDDDSCPGCPPSQTWCKHTNQITVPQLIVGFLICLVGYRVGLTLCLTVFSKVLGPTPSGVWMGIITASGSLSKVTGPLWISIVYQTLGTIYVYGICGVMTVFVIVILFIFYNNLAPMKMDASAKKSDHDIDSQTKL